MKPILSVILLFSTYIFIHSQNLDEIVSIFSTSECSKVESANEKEWKYARYLLSKIEPSFYDLNRTSQERDTISSLWFDKIFTRGKGENYSLDFNKIREEAANVNISDIPDIKKFTFIGMKIPLLENTQSIIHIELEDCPNELKNKFREQIKRVKDHYEVLTDLRSDEDKILMMRNKQPEPFTELIIVELGESPYLVKLKGVFDISDISAPKEYNE